jgi:hypothetical protein
MPSITSCASRWIDSVSKRPFEQSSSMVQLVPSLTTELCLHVPDSDRRRVDIDRATEAAPGVLRLVPPEPRPVGGSEFTPTQEAG